MSNATRLADDGAAIVTGELVSVGRRRMHDRHLAFAGYVARYKGSTRQNYSEGLREFFAWCDSHDLDVFDAKRGHLELYLRWLEEVRCQKASTASHKLSILNGFYRFAVADGFCETSPTLLVRRPRVPRVSTTNWLNVFEMAKLVRESERTGLHEHALICLLGLNGMRVSGACGIRIEDLGFSDGVTTAEITLKGGAPFTVPLSQPTAWAVSKVQADRSCGRLLLKPSGEPMDRIYALRLVKRLGKNAGITKRMSPHSLRHSFVTIARDAGVSTRDIMLSTGHTDERMIPYYDGRRESLHHNATHVVTSKVYSVD